METGLPMGTQPGQFPTCSFEGHCNAKVTTTGGSHCVLESLAEPQCQFRQESASLRMMSKVLMSMEPNHRHIDSRKALIVAFDVDMTLIDGEGQPQYHVIDLLRWFVANGNTVHVWSGGGIGYSQHWIDRLGLDDLGVTAIEKFSISVDIAVDDMADEITAVGQLKAKVIIKV